MKRKFATFTVSFILILAACAGKPNIPSAQVPTGPQLVTLQSVEGQQRFKESQSLTDFFPLANHFESQTNKLFCGPTTVAIVLNSLREDRLRKEALKVSADESLISSADRTYLNPSRSYVYNRYTQNNIFDVTYRTGAVLPKTKQQVMGKPSPNAKDADWGFQLRQLHGLFSAHGSRSEIHVVDQNTKLDDVRAIFRKNLSEPNNFIVVNYTRVALNQPGGGHISPVGAYHEKSDSALVMDVNPTTADWVWVPMTALYSAMNTHDTVENRGYLEVSE